MKNRMQSDIINHVRCVQTYYENNSDSKHNDAIYRGTNEDNNMKKDKVKVYLYTRVSTTMQIDGYSLEAQ